MKLVDFLIRAKKSGYACETGGRREEFEDGSVGFKFVEEDFTYYDRYYGSNPFSGSEYIYDIDGRVIWMMNYYGASNSDSIEVSKIYSFLREAMRNITPEYPFRGPKEYENNGLIYRNTQNGSFECFHGNEKIYATNLKLYDLYYHGGVI